MRPTDRDAALLTALADAAIEHRLRKVLGDQYRLPPDQDTLA